MSPQDIAYFADVVEMEPGTCTHIAYLHTHFKLIVEESPDIPDLLYCLDLIICVPIVWLSHGNSVIGLPLVGGSYSSIIGLHVNDEGDGCSRMLDQE